MKTLAWRQIRMNRHKTLLQCDGTHKRHEESLAGAILTDHEPERCAAVRDSVNVLNERLEFLIPSDLNMLQSQTWNHAAFQ